MNKKKAPKKLVLTRQTLANLQLRFVTGGDTGTPVSNIYVNDCSGRKRQ